MAVITIIPKIFPCEAEFIKLKRVQSNSKHQFLPFEETKEKDGYMTNPVIHNHFLTYH